VTISPQRKPAPYWSACECGALVVCGARQIVVDVQLAGVLRLEALDARHVFVDRAEPHLLDGRDDRAGEDFSRARTPDAQLSLFWLPIVRAPEDRAASADFL
jgi:hypothetical protein